jgi:hypothetical protein
MTNEAGPRKTILVPGDEAKEYASRGYTYLGVIRRGDTFFTLMQESDKPMIPANYPPRTSSGLLEED